MSCSEHTTSFLSDSTSGIARPAGTGVTSPTHSDDSRGVSSGTGIRTRGRSPATLGVPAHHLRIRQDVRAADVEAAADVRRQRRAADEITQHIMDGDWLDAGSHPFRGDHHRQPFGEIPQHLERRRPAADDHGSLQRGRRHATAQQDVPHLRARAQVR